MTYIVAEVHAWHPMKGHGLRKVAKTTTLHSRHTNLKEAVSLRSSLNAGRKQQRYWVLDESGRIANLESKIAK